MDFSITQKSFPERILLCLYLFKIYCISLVIFLIFYLCFSHYFISLPQSSSPSSPRPIFPPSLISYRNCFWFCFVFQLATFCALIVYGVRSFFTFLFVALSLLHNLWLFFAFLSCSFSCFLSGLGLSERKARE